MEEVSTNGKSIREILSMLDAKLPDKTNWFIQGPNFEVSVKAVHHALCNSILTPMHQMCTEF